MTPEGRVKAKVKGVLKRYQHIVDGFWPVPCGYGENWLDYTGLTFGGRRLDIETKKPGGKPRFRQVATIERIKRLGGAVFVIEDDNGVKALESYLAAVEDNDTE